MTNTQPFNEEQIARAILPTVWQMFDEYGNRLNPSAEADRKGSLAQARRVLSCLSSEPETVGEVDRLTRERDAATKIAVRRHEMICDLEQERNAARAALAETRERLEQIREDERDALFLAAERAGRRHIRSWIGLHGGMFPADRARSRQNGNNG